MKRLDLSFEYYFNVYSGGQKGVLNGQSFDSFRLRAERELLTYGLANVETDEFDEEIRLCVCEIAEAIFSFNSVGKVKSESVDGYSVTYAEGGSLSDEIRRIILRRLGDTGLLFAGVE